MEGRQWYEGYGESDTEWVREPREATKVRSRSCGRLIYTLTTLGGTIFILQVLIVMYLRNQIWQSGIGPLHLPEGDMMMDLAVAQVEAECDCFQGILISPRLS